jgi:hypothetical protein
VANLGAGDGMLNRIGSLLNIYCYYYGAGVSVRRVLRPTMKTRYDKIRLQNRRPVIVFARAGFGSGYAF